MRTNKIRKLDKYDIEQVDRILKQRHPFYYSCITLMDIFPFLSFFKWSWLMNRNPDKKFESGVTSINNENDSQNLDECLTNEYRYQYKLAKRARTLDKELYNLYEQPDIHIHQDNSGSENALKQLLPADHVRSDKTAQPSLRSNSLKNTTK